MKKTAKLTIMAMLTAISVVLVYLVHFWIFPAANFLEYDPADIPILIGAFMYGPIAGLALTLVASAIQALTVSAKSGLYGFIMHLISTGTLTAVASTIYLKLHRKNALLLPLALAGGVFAMAGVMLIANHFVTPVFMGVPVQTVDAMLLPVFLPFNIIKGGINSLITFFAYKHGIEPFFRKKLQ